jgi:hypothetical protein
MKDELLAAFAPQEERIEVAGRKLVVRELTAAADTAAFHDNVDMSWKLLVRCVFDGKGNPVFTDDDIPALKKSGKVKLKPVSDAVLRVNGYNTGELEKNSGAGPGAG